MFAWFVALCIFPDPRPLGSPEWSVRAVRGLGGLAEPMARALATLILRAAGFGVLGILISLVLSSARIVWAAPIVVLFATFLAVVSQWINHGHFPIAMQIQLAVVSVVIGTLVGDSIQRSLIAIVALIVFVFLAIPVIDGANFEPFAPNGFLDTSGLGIGVAGAAASIFFAFLTHCVALMSFVLMSSVFTALPP